jgi:hypothetical protein
MLLYVGLASAFSCPAAKSGNCQLTLLTFSIFVECIPQAGCCLLVQGTVKEGSFELDQIITKWTERHIAENAKDPRLQYRFDGLSPNTYYEIQIFASNKMGRSRDSNSFIFLTGHGRHSLVLYVKVSLSQGRFSWIDSMLSRPTL